MAADQKARGRGPGSAPGQAHTPGGVVWRAWPAELREVWPASRRGWTGRRGEAKGRAGLCVGGSGARGSGLEARPPGGGRGHGEHGRVRERAGGRLGGQAAALGEGAGAGRPERRGQRAAVLAASGIPGSGRRRSTPLPPRNTGVTWLREGVGERTFGEAGDVCGSPRSVTAGAQQLRASCPQTRLVGGGSERENWITNGLLRNVLCPRSGAPGLSVSKLSLQSPEWSAVPSFSDLQGPPLNPPPYARIVVYCLEGIYFYYFLKCKCISVCVCTFPSWCCSGPEECVGSPGAELTGSCECCQI